MNKLLKRCALISVFFLGAFFTGYAQTNKGTLNHIALSVYDLEKSTSFYTEVLQLDTLPEPFKDGKHAWLQIAPGYSMHLIEDATEITQHSRNTHTCFSVASIDKFLVHLNKFGIVYYSARGEKGKVGTRVDGVKQLYIQDPDGYWIEVNDEK